MLVRIKANQINYAVDILGKRYRSFQTLTSDMSAIIVKAELQIEIMKMMFYNPIAFNKKLRSFFQIMY